MWDGLDEVDWAGLKHNYGSARDVPDLLRRCAQRPADEAESAADHLLNLLFHQGGWICPVGLLRDVPARDERLRFGGGWHSFVTDESIRAAVGELLADG